MRVNEVTAIVNKMTKNIRLRYSSRLPCGRFNAPQDPVGTQVEQNGGKGEIDDFHRRSILPSCMKL